MAVKIPFKQFPSFKERVSLDGVAYQLFFNWNVRGEFWTVTFAQTDDTVLAGAIKLVIGIELIGQYPDRGLPPGELEVIDTTGTIDRPGLYDFYDGNVYLRYTPEAEL